MLWPVSLSLGCGRYYLVGTARKAIWLRHTQPLFNHRAASWANLLRAQLRQSAVALGAADGVQFGTNWAPLSRIPPVISSAQCGLLKGAMAFIARGRFSRDHCCTAWTRGAAATTFLLHGGWWPFGRQPLGVLDPRANSMAADPIGRHLLAMVPLSRCRLFCCDPYPFIGKSVIHKWPWRTLETFECSVVAR